LEELKIMIFKGIYFILFR